MRKKRYTFRQLFDLWVIWISDKNIRVQDLYERYNLPGSFIVWLKQKHYQKRYTLKKLHYLWIDWVNEYDLPCQEIFRRYNLDGSFVVWLAKKEKKL